MSRDLWKDIILLFIINTGSNFHLQWPVIYPYLGSYFKNFDSSITLNGTFSAIFVAYIGQFIGNSILPKLFFILGVKKTIQLGSILYFINCLSFYLFTSMFGLCLNLLAAGILSMFFSFTITYHFSEKYENGVYYSPYVFLSFSLQNFIWPMMMNAIINPNNVGMEEVTYVNGYKEVYYNYEISSGVVKYLNYHGFYVLIVNVLLCQLIDNPHNMQSRVSMWLTNTITGDRDSKKTFEKDFRQFSRTTMMNLGESIRGSIKQSVSVREPLKKKTTDVEMVHKKHEELIEKVEAQKQKELHEDIRQEMVSKRFICLVIVVTVRNAASNYFINNFKYMGNFIVNNEGLTSKIFSFASIANVFGRLAGPWLYAKYDFIDTHLIVIGSSMAVNIMFFTLATNISSVYLLLIFISRIIQGLSSAIHHITLFSLYGHEKAIYLYKIYDASLLFGLVYGIILNYYCTAGNQYSLIFFIFTMIEVGGIWVLLKILK